MQCSGSRNECRQMISAFPTNWTAIFFYTFHLVGRQNKTELKKLPCVLAQCASRQNNRFQGVMMTSVYLYLKKLLRKSKCTGCWCGKFYVSKGLYPVHSRTQCHHAVTQKSSSLNQNTSGIRTPCYSSFCLRITLMRDANTFQDHSFNGASAAVPTSIFTPVLCRYYR
jgi:hypothetical protein